MWLRDKLRRMFLHALSVALLAGLITVSVPAQPNPLDWQAGPAVVSARMSEAGYADMARGRQFLAFDDHGDGRAVEVIGDLATAKRIVVLVPGSDTSLATFDAGLGGVTHRAPAAQARALYNAVASQPGPQRGHQEAHVAVTSRPEPQAGSRAHQEAYSAVGSQPGQQQPGSQRGPRQVRALYPAVADQPGQQQKAGLAGEVAVVAWLGYDPPEGFGLAAMRQDRAVVGAAELARFVESLPGQATIVLVGHSYGAVVVSLAAHRFGPEVTDVIALAPPGMGARRVADLQANAKVWVAIADDDWIARVPKTRLAGLGHGPVPADASRLPVVGVRGHDGYLLPESSTLQAIARIITKTQPGD
jgi:hypothetical protein